MTDVERDTDRLGRPPPRGRSVSRWAAEQKYRTIVADPPWPYRTAMRKVNAPQGATKNELLPYASMSVDAICALQPEAASDAHLYLWTTNSFIEAAYQVARAWNFKPSTLLVWCKGGRAFTGLPTYSICTEFALFARRGSLSALRREARNWWEWPRSHHSSKPDAFLDMVEEVSPGPRLEMFARRARFGWDYWGDESLQTAEIPT